MRQYLAPESASLLGDALPDASDPIRGASILRYGGTRHILFGLDPLALPFKVLYTRLKFGGFAQFIASELKDSWYNQFTIA